MKPAPRNINYYIDLVWEDGQPRIYVAGKRFNQCSFLVASVNTADPRTPDLTIEDLANLPGARVMEGKDALQFGLTADEIMFAHASNLEGWVRSGYKTACLHANLSFPLLKELARVGDAKAKRVLQAEIIERLNADNMSTSIVIIETCADVMEPAAWRVAGSSVHEGLRRVIAGNRSTPAAVLANLAKDREREVRLRVADNPNTPAAVQATLAKDREREVRLRVADNPNTPAAVLATLSMDPDAYVRRRVAGNPNTPAAVLATLSMDPYAYVRDTVAWNPSTPAAVLATLAKDREREVRLRVADNPNTPAAVLATLAKAKSEDEQDG